MISKIVNGGLGVTLKEKILSRDATLGVVGLGYVGLPLAIEFCKAGYKVIGLDTNQEKIQALLEGESYVLDVPSEDVSEAIKSQHFMPTTNFNRLNDVDTVSICVPTPLRKSKEPDVSYIVAVVDDLKPRLHKTMLVVLESTTYPCTTEELVKVEIEKQGFIVGEDVYLCFSPERVDPGNAIYQTKNTPKIIGGITPACTELGVLLYSQAVNRVVPVSTARAAEMVKLLENTFRAVNIGLVNEMAMMCQRMGIDIWEVTDAAATKPYGYMPFYPGPGIGGHCIPLDPVYLSWKAKSFHFYNRFIDLASEVNDNMPRHVVQCVSDVLNLEEKSISGSKILCLGMAYKKDINDCRESPSLDVMRLLEKQGATVEYNDPFVPQFADASLLMESVILTKETINNADCVLLLTDHSKYDYNFIAEHARLILDTRNAFKGIESPRIFRIGSPLPGVKEWNDAKRLTVNEAAATKDKY